MMPVTPTMPRPRLARAFTLVELLVAVSIVVLASVLLLPGFAKIIESTNYSSAINLTTSALGQARSLAIRNNRHAGVAFYFDYATETCTLQIIELQTAGGTGYLTSSVAFQTSGAYCQPFRPAAGQAPVELPKGFCVYGLSFAAQRTRAPDNNAIPSNLIRIDNGVNGSGPTFHWYAGELVEEGVAPTNAGAGEATPWFPPRTDPSLYTTDGTNPWLTPRSSWGGRGQEFRTAVRHAQTFAIFFDPTGSVVSATSQGGDDLQNAYIELGDAPVDRAPPVPGPRLPLDQPNTFDPEFVFGSPVDPTPNPEVRLRSAGALAVVDLAKMSRDVQLPRAWLARPATAVANAPPRRADLQGFFANGVADAYFNNTMIRRISAWVDRNADVLTFNRFTGNVNRRAGS